MTILGQILSAPVRVYQYLISPMLPPTCRYSPTCSEYALEAMREHGGLAGGLLALRRIGRCHPWGEAGYDPVPSNLAKDQEEHGSAVLAGPNEQNTSITPTGADRK